ncbi:MAG: DUF357 domain-containing protein [Methanomassiliicoccales archaeon]
MSPDETIREERLTRYLKLAEEALSSVHIAVSTHGTMRNVAEDMFRMASDYISDAKHFVSEGKYVDAFACINYAYGWLDAGARTGLFDVGEDYKRFTLGR